MFLDIQGLNTGVIRHGDNFLALAMKIRPTNTTETLLFFPALSLRDLLMGLESRIAQHHSQTEEQRHARANAHQRIKQSMLAAMPEISQHELSHADIAQRVEKVVLSANDKDKLTYTLTLHNGSEYEFVIADAQIEHVVMASAMALKNAGMNTLMLRLSSMLDFLPRYDAERKKDGNFEYDTYDHPTWKNDLFPYQQAIIYIYTDEAGNKQEYGTVIKTRCQSNTAEIEAISRRLLKYSQRLNILDGKACQVIVRTLTATPHQTVTLEDCMRALHQLSQSSQQKH